MKRIIVFSMLIAVLAGCHKKDVSPQQKQQHIVVAKLEKSSTPIYFSGILAPIRTIPVVSPVDGRVAEINFSYGEYVNKGQLVAIVGSQQLADDYQKAVTDYLQKKDAYGSAIQTFQGSTMLYKAGLMSKSDFVNAKSQYETAVLNYYQSQQDLAKVLHKANIKVATIEKLTLGDLTGVRKILQKQFTRIKVFAPGSGVALFPIPGESTGGDGSDSKGNGKLVVGSDLKAGQLMFNIGDKSGFSAKIAVSEIDIVRIKEGMKAKVTGDAFPNTTLNGVVTDVASQANPQEGGNGQSLSQFNVNIKIPDISEYQRQIIHVGMTAKIEIDIQETPQIMLPIEAVSHSNGQTVVTVQDAAGHRKQVIVVTGETTPTQVSILKGLKPGDKVVVDD